MKIIALLVFAIFVNISCMPQEEKEEAPEPQFVAVKKGDPELLKTVMEAQESLDFFFDTHDRYKENLGVFFGIKIPIQDGDTTAHLWYTYKGVENGILIGEHFEIPKELIAHKSVRVKKEEVEDWMINDHGHLYGGYSIRLQRLRTPEDKRAEFDEYSGIREYKKHEF